jgi:hypothetical protein
VGASRPLAPDALGGPHWRRLTPRRSTTLAWSLLAILLAISGGLVVYLGRGTTFWFDEWQWILYRRGNDLAAFLRPYNGHFSLIPVAIYRLLFATVGLTAYAPYRVISLVLHLLCGTLVFVYARSRAGKFVALCAAALVLFLGAGWQDILWPFQLAWLISVAAGIGALLLLDRRDRSGDVGAAVLLAVSLASSGLGIVFALGVVVDILWGRKAWRDAWIFVAPGALYGVWWITDQHSPPLDPLRLVPRFVANAASASLAGVVGASSPRPAGSLLNSDSLLSVGRPLAVVALLVIIARLVYLRRIPARVVTVSVILIAFWFLTALTRATTGNGAEAWASRYLYVGGLLLIILAVELFRGASLPLPINLLVGGLVVVALYGGVTSLRDAGFDLRQYAEETRADLGALELGRNIVSPSYTSAWIPGSPLIYVRAGPYFSAAKALGTPAASPAGIAASSESARAIADLELIRIHAVSLQPGAGGVEGGTPPVAADASGGTLIAHGPCLTLQRRSGVAELDLSAASLQLLVRARGGSATVGVRRFAGAFVTLGVIPPTGAATLRIGPDLSARPWYIRLATADAVTACRLR